MSVRKAFLVLLMFLVLVSHSLVFLAFAEVGENEAASALAGAEESVSLGYQAVLKAEETGANVSGLLVRLNDAGSLLASARMSYRNGDFDTVGMLAGLSKNIGGDVQNSAVQLKDYELVEGQRRSLFTIVASVGGLVAIAVGSFGIWHFLKRKYGQYRGWFFVGSLVLMLLAVAPTSAMYIRLPGGSESFSELWLLGSGHKAEDYPFNVKVNETYSVYVGVGNHLGHSAYYRVYVKCRNETQPLPVPSNSTPSSMQELYEFDFLVRDQGVWETLLNFRILDAEYGNDSVILKSLSINEVTFKVDRVSAWNNARSGFYDQLFFELWLYDVTSRSFQYNNRSVSIWLNMTT